MSGHNKWSSIKHTKGKNDAAMSKIFSKIGKEIAVAVKLGGPDPNSNPKLRNIIQKAKQNNMPNDNITRSIKKASGETNAINYESITYEGYGPAGSAIIVETLTDNKNRTASDVRHLFDRFGGSLGSTNCVSYLFKRKGLIIVEKGVGVSEDDLMMNALESGADDVANFDLYYEIYTTPEAFDGVKDYFDEHKIPYVSAEVTMLPDNYIELPQDKLNSFNKLIDALEDNDDVQDVYHNVDVPESDEE